MKISIITINYNNLEGLKKTVNSVIQQDSKDFEYIIIDGASTDGSKEFISQNNCHLAYWISEKDNGIFNAMNKGALKAKGDYIFFLNSGDYLASSRVISEVISEMKGNCDFYSGDMLYTDEELGLKKSPREVSTWYMYTSFLPHPATFIKRSMFLKNPYREDYKIVSDWAQMFYEISINDATYQRIELLVSIFDCTGISSSEDKTEQNAERQRFVDECFSQRAQKELFNPANYIRARQKEIFNKYAKKIVQALDIKSPIARDIKILRYALKLLYHDIF